MLQMSFTCEKLCPSSWLPACKADNEAALFRHECVTHSPVKWAYRLGYNVMAKTAYHVV